MIHNNYICTLCFQEYVFPKSALSRDQIAAMHSTSVGDVDDMARLGDLHEASILYNMSKRYKKEVIYVSYYDLQFIFNSYNAFYQFAKRVSKNHNVD